MHLLAMRISSSEKCLLCPIHKAGPDCFVVEFLELLCILDVNIRIANLFLFLIVVSLFSVSVAAQKL